MSSFLGGGFLIVPALVLFAGLDMREAVGTSLLVLSINAAAGLFGLRGGGRDLPGGGQPEGGRKRPLTGPPVRTESSLGPVPEPHRTSVTAIQK